MEKTASIYQDMAARTGGSVYIGVVGPVRTGKSTFVKRFMRHRCSPTSTMCTAATAPRMSCRRAAQAALS